MGAGDIDPEFLKEEFRNSIFKKFSEGRNTFTVSTPAEIIAGLQRIIEEIPPTPPPVETIQFTFADQSPEFLKMVENERRVTYVDMSPKLHIIGIDTVKYEHITITPTNTVKYQHICSTTIIQSRNKREGRYAHKVGGRHCRLGPSRAGYTTVMWDNGQIIWEEAR